MPNPLSILQPRVNKETVETALYRSSMARQLVESEAFQWWREILQEWIEEQKRRLDYTLSKGAGESLQYVLRKGKMLGVSQVLEELDFMSGNLERLEEKLKEIEDDKPVVGWPKAI